MQEKSKKKNISLPFEGFIRHLKSQGFIIGVDHHLRLNSVLNLIGPDSKPKDLKYLLCPIFATNAKQQDIFYRTFDRYFSFSAFQESYEKSVQKKVADKSFDDEIKEPAYGKKRLYILFALLLVLAVAGLFDWWNQKDAVQALPENIISPPDNVKLEELLVKVPPQLEAQELTFYEKNARTIRWTSALAPLIIFLLAELYRISRKKIVLQRQKSKKSPLLLPIEVETYEPGFVKTRRFYSAAARLRQREPGDIQVLDVDKTVDDSVKSSGFPVFRYKTLTKPPEYLILIRLPMFSDHFAWMMNTITDALKNDGIFVFRYFFRDDPRLCFKDPGKPRESLPVLYNRYAHCRLIIAGSGDELLDPMSGEPDTWSSVFTSWKQRAILTPRPPVKWGMKEVSLAREFIVLPATMDGMAALVDYFENPESLNLKKWVRSDTRPNLPESDEIESVPALKDYMGGGEKFQWLCACAVYPEVSWSLTIHLALFCFSGGKIPEQAMLKLIRLPWFKNGRMPDDLRLGLIAELDDTKAQIIRKAIVDVLKNEKLAKDSGAWDAYRLNLAVFSWMVSKKKRKALQEVKDAARNLDENRIVQDYTLMRIIDSGPRSPLSFILPKRFHKFFFRKGISLFGVKTSIRCVAALLVAAAAVFMIQEPDIGIRKGFSMEFVKIPAGEFIMGSPEDEEGRYDREKQHRVTLTKNYYMQKTEVTQAQWEAVVGNKPSYFKNCGDDCPVENVSWNDVQDFIKKLNKRTKTTLFRLPTEAEWEYACRAGTTTPFYFGKCLSTDDANYEGKYPIKGCPEGESRGNTIKVGTLSPNGWGLYDMHGNVWEWCQDQYGDYPTKPVVDPTGVEGIGVKLSRITI
ncbi:formylglycine-generating enzyme family protein [Desulfobacterales bacterium HSG16]|nr:formylglycine-generating enzyme family protein [Desulfobacterales bacterium HSG16]